jgi:ABC-type transporter Mla MlaB component
MEKQRLIETLQQLRAELAQMERVDPTTLARLEEVTREVEQVLGEREDTSAEELEPVSGLRDLLLKYEAEHPQLSATIGRVADALAAMGI